ncbi:flavo protein [Sparassis crispa]|uniref:Flavo protein n=1 Tax=Sparassis crispa TaxID=139825 RepID=A0A401GH95_9APHY|nr:flavo protein [Sparassis crispa]GBE81566.1 flavo protein [Sparassis crispa]
MAAELPKFNPAPAFKFSQSPNPSYKFGEGLDPNVSELAKGWKEDEKKGWKSWTLEETHGKDVYTLLTSSVIPRPIAFVSTLGADGTPNLAPMSYFSLIAHDPPMIGLSFALFMGIPKNTRDNILATKEFTVSLISEPFLEAANACSIDAPPEVNEWLVSGLTPVPSNLVKPAWVKESAISLECELFQVHHLASLHNSMEITTTFVMGSIKRVHVRNAVLGADGVNVDPAKLRAVSRLGGFTYARVGEGIDLGIPMWAQDQTAVTEVVERKSKK